MMDNSPSATPEEVSSQRTGPPHYSEAKDVLDLAAEVLHNDDPDLDGRREVTAAALTRQAVELAVNGYLESESGPTRGRWREAFLCVAALQYPEDALARELHNTWGRLSDACHATSYDLPPTMHDLERWMATTRRFIH
jgi:hypothetical protein